VLFFFFLFFFVFCFFFSHCKATLGSLSKSKWRINREPGFFPREVPIDGQSMKPLFRGGAAKGPGQKRNL